MKILIVHNSYQFRGGEDEVVRSEMKMLRGHGHKIVLYRRKNRELGVKIRFIKWFLRRFILKQPNRVDSKTEYERARREIQKEKPDIVHIHNTFYVINRSIYQACRDENVPVVQSLHNYRFLCPIAIFWRPAKGVCEDCLEAGNFQPAIKNRCWKNSTLHSMFLADLVKSYRENSFLKTHVDHFIVLNEFSRNKYQENGFKDCKFSIKPQFLHFDPGAPLKRADYCLYAGGFFQYKGVTTLLKAWQKFHGKYQLKLLGKGPLLKELAKKYSASNIEFVGQKKPKETMEYMKKSLFIIVSSECYEAGPRVIIEAFACGIPVLGSSFIGPIKELIREGKNGLIFKGGDPSDLAAKAEFLLQNREKTLEMGRNAREEFEEKYTMEKNYPLLEKIYNDVLNSRKDHGRS